MNIGRRLIQNRAVDDDFMAEMTDGISGKFALLFYAPLVENGKQYVRFDSLLSAALIFSF